MVEPQPHLEDHQPVIQKLDDIPVTKSYGSEQSEDILADTPGSINQKSIQISQNLKDIQSESKQKQKIQQEIKLVTDFQKEDKQEQPKQEEKKEGNIRQILEYVPQYQSLDDSSKLVQKQEIRQQAKEFVNGLINTEMERRNSLQILEGYRNPEEEHTDSQNTGGLKNVLSALIVLGMVAIGGFFVFRKLKF